MFCGDTSTPCRFASVTVQTLPPQDSGTSTTPAVSYSTTADIEGRFSLTAVRVGDYYIVGGLAGYVSPYDYAANAFQDNASLRTKAIDAVLPHISVLAGKTAFSDLTLFRGAAMEGTVHYDDGAPAINLPVSIWFKDATGKWAQFHRNDTDPDLLPLGLGSRTDDKGHFREGRFATRSLLRGDKPAELCCLAK